MDRARFEEMLTLAATRRRFLVGGVAAAGLTAAVSLPGRATRLANQSGTPSASPAASPGATPTLGGNPFTLGVASGDPLPESVVLWTRLAPEPIDGGGMDPVAVEVRWELADDDGFRGVVQSGTATATPELGHSVHVDVTGLLPGRVYYYRFMAGGEVSPTGRTKTAPAANAPVDRMRFAYASCQHWEQGYFTAYRAMAREDLDLVLHLGDYIYEYAAGAGYADGGALPVRLHTGEEINSLADYRNRHALYKTDPDLQAAHAAFPWATTWDDHEVDNNYAAASSEEGVPPEEFLFRRHNAYQAYYEHLPLRPSSLPQGPDLQLYRRLSYGTLAEFQILDTRQYRTDHPCGDGQQVRCPAAMDPDATMTGPAQERWLLEGLDASAATWNVLAQQVMMAQLDLESGPAQVFAQDLWDGYPAARNRILGHALSRGTANPVVLTGDIHSSWVNDLKADFADASSPTVATELVVTSISSGGDPAAADVEESAETAADLLADNPHIKFFNSNLRGYVSCEVTPDQWRADYQAVAAVTVPDAPVSTQASFVIEAGRPGAQPA